MAPWCNRAPAGPFRLGARIVDLAANFPDGSAIHGLVHDRPWRRVGPAAWRIDHARGRWPWRYAVQVAYAVHGDGFVIELAVENGDDEAMPVGVGWHPWFRSPVTVTIPSATVFASNLGSSASPVPARGEFDRRRPSALSPGLDATWTGLTAREVALWWREPGLGASMRFSGALAYVAAASPHGLDAVAIEPQSHAPDAFRRLLGGETGSLRWLEPGATLDATIQIVLSRDAAGDVRTRRS